MEPVQSAGSMDSQPSFVAKLLHSFKRQYQSVLDASVPLLVARWVFLGAVILCYAFRVYMVQGFYIVTYGLGIFLLNLFIGFLSPLEDVEDGEALPTSNSDASEFKPFVR